MRCSCEYSYRKRSILVPQPVPCGQRMRTDCGPDFHMLVGAPNSRVMAMGDRKTVVQVKFRLREGLIDKLTKAAKAKDHSLNEEVERRLEQSFEKEEVAALVQQVASAAATSALQKVGLNLDPEGNPTEEFSVIWNKKAAREGGGKG